MAKIVPEAKMKYALALSNTSNKDIEDTQKQIKALLAKKFRIVRTARNERFHGELMGMGWDNWTDIVNIEKIKFAQNATKYPKSVLGTLVRGAINRWRNTSSEQENPLEIRKRGREQAKVG